MKTRCLHLIICLAMLLSCGVAAAADGSVFRRIDTGDGLSNSQVNCIFKDREGFLWFGTGMGLSRFDGFRFRNFYQEAADSLSLRSNLVTAIMESADGMMWIHTDEGYCLYDHATEKFDRNPVRWMRSHGMHGQPENVFADRRGNLVIVAYGVGCWYYDFRTRHARLIPFGRGRGQLPVGTVSGITERGRSLVLTYSDGLLARIDPQRGMVVWLNPWPRKAFGGNGGQGYYTFIDSHWNYYVYTNGHTLVYSSAARRWYGSIAQFLSAAGISCPAADIGIKGMQEDNAGNLWLATEHGGLAMFNLRRGTYVNYTYSSLNPSSLPDNTLQCAFADSDGAVWAGTLRNGAAYLSPSQTRFATIPAGDICTMTEDHEGRVWMGSNDAGISCYDPRTGRTQHYGRSETGLGTDVVVSSLCSRDGSLWFGTFNGGMTRWRDGRFTPVRASSGGLANNSVWALAEDRQGHIVIGTLGSGVQLLDPVTMRFTTINASPTNRLSSDYIASLYTCRDGRVLAAHSQNFSIIDTRTGKVTNFPTTRGGTQFASRAVNQIIEDSRGLIWCANMSGLNVYDPKSDRLYTLSEPSQLACSVTEDRRGDVWVALSHGVSRFSVSREGRGWSFFATSFDELDGLQSRRLNYRSILTAHSGEVMVGGQDGVNVISPARTAVPAARAKAVFSGLVLFDRPLNVGEEYDGRVVLDRAVNTGRTLRLKYTENAFTVLLASDHVSVPQKVRFMYRLDGFNDDQWLVTADGQPAVTYTNLSPGRYTLQVRVVNRNGSVSPETSSLSIVIEPPFWLTGWAYALYVLLACAAAWLVWRVTIRRQIVRLRIEQIQKEAERNRRMDEMKLTFLTSISHELRTPLTLIISPLKAMLKSETDVERRSKVSMILRNANRLLDLVNQTLDLRRIEKNKAVLNLANGNVTDYLRGLCDNFKALSGRSVELVFTAEKEEIRMSFDEDKLDKIITNLLSNAFKFTPDGGRVTVTVSEEKRFSADGATAQNMLVISVADTGTGISDADKEHIFDRFYQVSQAGGHVHGGSGIGLNLVKEFTALHEGTVRVADNPGGGTVFTVTLPCRLYPSLPEISVREPEDAPADVQEVQASPSAEVLAADGGAVLGMMNSLLKKGEYEVLVVDDSDDFLEFMTGQLSEMYRVRTARNGREALKEVASSRPDIILSDVMMPEMDGNELCRALKANPKTERIPFVMLTARLSTEHKIESLTNGADDYITKPFNLDLLNLRIANLIKWRHATPVGEKIAPEIHRQEVTSLDEKLVRQATEYVERNLSNPDLSVETMSEELSMSRVHLYKRLLSVTGSTPSEFIRTIRLRHAVHLLKDGQLNVSEVAYRVGFNNPRYFSKYFKEMYGVMPSQYKKGTACEGSD